MKKIKSGWRFLQDYSLSFYEALESSFYKEHILSFLIILMVAPLLYVILMPYIAIKYSHTNGGEDL